VTRPAAIAVFGYARPFFLSKTLTALEHCHGFRGQRVHVFCDAPSCEADLPGVEAAQMVASAWCRRHAARFVPRATNLGLRNITEGMNELCSSEGMAISFEDDHLPAPRALDFLDQALDRYQHDESVFQVSAYRPGRPMTGGPDMFFLPVPMPLGWGTWERAWTRFSWECADAHSILASSVLRQSFNLDGAYPAATLLTEALSGEFNSYFIRWYCAMFVANAVALCARDSLVHNIGLGSGLHGHARSERKARFHNGAWNPGAYVDEWTFPTTVEIDHNALALLRDDLRMLVG